MLNLYKLGFCGRVLDYVRGVLDYGGLEGAYHIQIVGPIVFIYFIFYLFLPLFYYLFASN